MTDDRDARNLDGFLKKLQKNSYFNTKRQMRFDRQRFNSSDSVTIIDDSPETTADFKPEKTKSCENKEKTFRVE